MMMRVKNFLTLIKNVLKLPRIKFKNNITKNKEINNLDRFIYIEKI